MQLSLVPCFFSRMEKGQEALGPTSSNGPVMDDIADNNKDSIYGANDAHVCIFN